MKEVILHKICCEQPCHDEGYCLLKELIAHDAKYSERMLAQMDCVNRWKYEESNRMGYDIGWKVALETWVNKGYAQRFAEVYQDGLSSIEVFLVAVGRSRSEELLPPVSELLPETHLSK